MSSGGDIEGRWRLLPFKTLIQLPLLRLLVCCFSVLWIISSSSFCVVNGRDDDDDIDISKSSTTISSGCGGPSTKYPSGSSLNCSFNGACQPNGECSCFPGWVGSFCETLDLMPTQIIRA